MGTMSSDPNEETMNLQSNSPEGSIENKTSGVNQDDEEDQRKFFEKITKCFTSNSQGRNKKGQQDIVETNERDIKSSHYTVHVKGLNEGLRASLSDFNDYDNVQNDDHQPKKRDRSASNENFGLPPLPSLEENRDLNNQNREDLANYKSNEQINSIKPDTFLSLKASIDDNEQENVAEGFGDLQTLNEGIMGIELNLDDDEEMDSEDQKLIQRTT